jgi:hypothetical protein
LKEETKQKIVGLKENDRESNMKKSFVVWNVCEFKWKMRNLLQKFLEWKNVILIDSIT